MSRTSRVLVRGLVPLFTAFLVGACTPTVPPNPTLTPVQPTAAATTPPATPAVTAAATAAPTIALATPEPTIAFTPGTAAAPRTIDMTVNDNLQFQPGLIQVVKGETVTFQVKNLGKASHEMMVGPVDKAFGDVEGTPEVADIGAGETKSLTVTFDGDGPYAFACHEPGHFEHGMLGYIQFVGPGAPAVGTKANPRVVWMNMDDTLKFMPDSLTVTKGETIRFVLTNSGQVTHEFQVGPSDMVAADNVDGVLTLEKDELKAGSTTALDYTFDGTGPYAYACHEPGHYEAGMHGDIVLK